MPHARPPVHEVKAALFRVLGHPARVRILELLRDGERSVGRAAGGARARLGRHVAASGALRRIGLVESRREGTSVHYRVDDERVFDLLAAGKDIVTRRLRSGAVDPARARELVTGALLVGGARARRGWAAVCRRRARHVPARPRRPGRGRRADRASRGSGARGGGDARRGVHERARAAAGRRRPDRLLPRHARRGRAPRRSSSRPAYLEPTPEGGRLRRAHGAVRARARRRLLRARPAHVPPRLGVDDAAAGRGDPRRARRRRARRGRRCSPTSRSRTSAGRGRGSRSCCWPTAGAFGGPSRSRRVRACRSAIALAALVGMGTKAGVMPLHVWLPRAHPIAPAPVSALMSGVMIKVAIYGLVRVLVEWLGVLPAWLGRARARGSARCRRWAASSTRSSSTISSGCSRSTRSRTSASSCSGSAPASLLRARGADELGGLRARRGAAAHAQPRGLQGAALPRRGGVRARGRLARARPARRAAAADAVDGRRVPRRGDGDRGAAAAERLRLRVADAAGAAARGGATAASATASRGGGARPRSRRRRRWRCSASSRSSGSCCSGRRGAAPSPRRRRRRWRCGPASSSSRSPASCSGSRPGCSSAPLVGARAVGRRRADRASASTCPGPARCRPAGSRSSSSRSRALLALARGVASRRPRRAGPAGSSSSPSSRGRAPASRSRCGSCSRPCCARSGEIDVRTRRRRRAGGLLQRARCRT